MRLLDDVGGLGRHAQRLFGFAVGDVAAPGERLAVEVVEIGEVPADEKIRLDIGEGPFDPAFAIRVAHPVRAEPEAERAGEGGHLRRDDGVGPRAGGEQHGGVVDDADRADARHEARRLEQEGARLEAGEARIVLDEQPARVGQHQAGTLQGDRLAGLSEPHAVRRGVVLHLLAGREVVFAGASRRAAQIRRRGPSGSRCCRAPPAPHRPAIRAPGPRCRGRGRRRPSAGPASPRRMAAAHHPHHRPAHAGSAARCCATSPAGG